MSRFEEVVNDAIGEVILGESAFRAETLAQHIAEKVRDRQGARRAEVHLDARYPEYKPAPHSGIRTQEIYTLHGIAVAGADGTKRLDRRDRAGHDRVPVRADAGAGELARAAARRRLRRGRDRADLRGRAGRDAQPARARHAARRLPGGVRHRHRRPAPARDRRGLDVVGDLRADEALRRGRRGREGAPPARASSRTACAR